MYNVAMQNKENSIGHLKGLSSFYFIRLFNTGLLQKILCIIVTMIFSFLITTRLQAQDNEETGRLFHLAQTYEQNGQLDKAETIYRELVNRQSMNYGYFDALNKVIIKQKKYSESIELLQSRIKITPQDINLYGMLGSTYYMMDDLQDAYDSWERGVATNPSSPMVYRVMANYAIENRAFEKAIDFLERGQRLTDDPLIFSLDLGNIYSVNMRFADAANEYCRLLEVRPNEIEVVKIPANDIAMELGRVSLKQLPVQ